MFQLCHSQSFTTRSGSNGRESLHPVVSNADSIEAVN